VRSEGGSPRRSHQSHGHKIDAVLFSRPVKSPASPRPIAPACKPASNRWNDERIRSRSRAPRRRRSGPPGRTRTRTRLRPIRRTAGLRPCDRVSSRRGDAGRGFDELARAGFSDFVSDRYLDAEDESRGHLLNATGRPPAPLSRPHWTGGSRHASAPRVRPMPIAPDDEADDRFDDGRRVEAGHHGLTSPRTTSARSATTTSNTGSS
jgi:hypothetical protein